MYNWEPVHPSNLMEFPAPAPSLLEHHMFFFLLCKSLLYGKAALDKSEFSPLKCYHTLLLYFFIWLCSRSIMFCWSSHVSPKWQYSVSFLGRVIFLCVFVPELLYPSCS